MATDLTRIGEKACKEPELVFTSLYHHIYDVDNLRACYDALDGRKARGADGVSKAEYGKNLKGKLQDLSAELTRGTTTLLVTHDAAEALRMAHRIIILGGTPAEVKTTINLQTKPPRSPDSKEVLENYGSLVELLLEDHH